MFSGWVKVGFIFQIRFQKVEEWFQNSELLIERLVFPFKHFNEKLRLNDFQYSSLL